MFKSLSMNKKDVACYSGSSSGSVSPLFPLWVLGRFASAVRGFSVVCLRGWSAWVCFSLVCGVFSWLLFLLFLLFLLWPLFLGALLLLLTVSAGVRLLALSLSGFLVLASRPLSLCVVGLVARLLRLCLLWWPLSVLPVIPVCPCVWACALVGLALAGSVPLLLLRNVPVLRLMLLCRLSLVVLFRGLWLSCGCCVVSVLTWLLRLLNLCGLSPSGGSPRGGWVSPSQSPRGFPLLVSLWAILPVNVLERN